MLTYQVETRVKEVADKILKSDQIPLYKSS